MAETEYTSDDRVTDIFQPATRLHRDVALFPGPLGLLSCDIETVVSYASHQMSRAKARMDLYSGSPAPGLPATGGHIDEGYDDAHGLVHSRTQLRRRRYALQPHHQRIGRPVGWVQVYVGKWIWWGWRSENELSVDWSNVTCLGHTLVWHDQYQRKWVLKFELVLADSAPSWPDWLLPGRAPN